MSSHTYSPDGDETSTVDIYNMWKNGTITREEAAEQLEDIELDVEAIIEELNDG